MGGVAAAGDVRRVGGVGEIVVVAGAAGTAAGGPPHRPWARATGIGEGAAVAVDIVAGIGGRGLVGADAEVLGADRAVEVHDTRRVERELRVGGAGRAAGDVHVAVTGGAGVALGGRGGDVVVEVVTAAVRVAGRRDDVAAGALVDRGDAVAPLRRFGRVAGAGRLPGDAGVPGSPAVGVVARDVVAGVAAARHLAAAVIGVGGALVDGPPVRVEDHVHQEAGDQPLVGGPAGLVVKVVGGGVPEMALVATVIDTFRRAVHARRRRRGCRGRCRRRSAGCRGRCRNPP